MESHARALFWSLWIVFCGACGSPTGSDEPLPASDVSGSEPPPLACPSPEHAAARTTYYVAANEPGASNEACDGLSPVDRGNGHCPFEDFRSARTFALLRDAAGVRVEVRAGTYSFATEALTVSGSGSDESERVVLTAYENEPVVFDGRGTLREVIRVSGRFATVERVTLRNSGGYNLEIRGGSEARVQCVRFEQNMASDALKGDHGASGVSIRHNEFSRWSSQAIDLTDVRDVTIEQNLFHDPRVPDAFAVGVKLGSRGVSIVDNVIRDSGGFSLGGTSSSHSGAFEAFDVTAERNRLEGLTNFPVKFYSCRGCVFRDNDVIGGKGSVAFDIELEEGPGGCAGGCRPSQDVSVTANRFKNVAGGPEGRADTFWGVETLPGFSFRASENLYCVSPGGEATFVLDDVPLDFAAWKRVTGTDVTSVVAVAGAAACAGW